MSEAFGVEEFEKVDAIPQVDQDENVTSTSFTGEMAEEDRYEPSPSAPPAEADLLGDFLATSSNDKVAKESPNEEPLLTFDSPVPDAPVVTETHSARSPQPLATEESPSKGNKNMLTSMFIPSIHNCHMCK